MGRGESERGNSFNPAGGFLRALKERRAENSPGAGEPTAEQAEEFLRNPRGTYDSSEEWQYHIVDALRLLRCSRELTEEEDAQAQRFFQHALRSLLGSKKFQLEQPPSARFDFNRSYNKSQAGEAAFWLAKSGADQAELEQMIAEQREGVSVDTQKLWREVREEWERAAYPAAEKPFEEAPWEYFVNAHHSAQDRALANQLPETIERVRVARDDESVTEAYTDLLRLIAPSYVDQAEFEIGGEIPAFHPMSPGAAKINWYRVGSALDRYFDYETQLLHSTPPTNAIGHCDFRPLPADNLVRQLSRALGMSEGEVSMRLQGARSHHRYQEQQRQKKLSAAETARGADR